MFEKKASFAVFVTITLVMVGLIHWIGLGDYPSYLKVISGSSLLAAVLYMVLRDLDNLKEDTSL